ncbi:MAG: DUF1573 domain-containing protein [Acidobacteria bacterium]|nr:MAG: DUF1573 domain-containing protein [Acidobacteriota bacterium]
MRWSTGVILVSSLAAAAAPSWGAGRLEIPERDYDAGRVEIGTVVEHDFVFRNVGDAPVLITQVRPSCGCTVSDYPPRIEPGEEGAVTLRVDTSKLHSGKQVKSATVVTDAPGAERVVLEVKLDLFAALEFLPKALVYLRVDQGHEKVEKILARPHRPGLKITDVVTNSPYLEATVAPADAPKRESEGEGLASLLLPREGDYWITVKVKDDAPAGLLRGEVTVRTNDESHPTGVIRVNAVVEGPRKAAES